MKIAFSVSLCLLAVTVFANTESDSLLQQLNVAIEHRDVFLKEKLNRIAKYKLNINKAGHRDQLKLYEDYLAIYQEYKSFIYDSAFKYARKMQDIAYRINDPVLISNGRSKLGFVLVSSGLFNEALDTLQKIRLTHLPDSFKTEFYYLMARTNYDLADFNRDDFYSERYMDRGNKYIDSAMALSPRNTSQYLLFKGLKSLHLREVAVAQLAYEEMISKFKLTDSEFAVAASTLSFIYRYTSQQDKSKEMLIKAAIADIRSSTKETLATLNLADLLYKEGDIENSYKYVKIAMEDANFYGARHRKVQVSAVFPIIEGRQLNVIESKRKMLLMYASIITVLSILLIGFAFIIYRQFRTLQLAKKTISDANAILTETNQHLVDATKIKEEYIWYYFTTTAEYITKLESLKKTMDLKLMTKKLDDLRFTVDSINIKKEREDLYHNFDKVFLKLFPDFVKVFNSLFKKEDQIIIKDDQLLNTELRIFALVRMGIHDHEKIAKILDYSVTTIYTYKTRIRSKSLLSNEDFDRKIMTIRAI